MKVTIDEETCIGWGACETACPEVFYMEDEKAKIKEDVNLDDYVDGIKEGAENCPVECIQIEE